MKMDAILSGLITFVVAIIAAKIMLRIMY